MKKHSKIALVACAAVFISTFGGCKKGENDPFLSLRSRKARVTGQWKAEKMSEKTDFQSSGTAVSTNTFIPGENKSTSSTTGFNLNEINGSSFNTSGSSQNTGDFSMSRTYAGSGSAKYTVTFEKEGTFLIKSEMAVTTEHTESGSGSSDTYTTSEVTTNESSGTWNFLGGVEDDYKNKERIVLNYTKQVSNSTETTEYGVETYNSTYTYGNGEYSEVWQIKGLKNKEMEIVGDFKGTRTYKSGSVEPAGQYTSEGSSSYTGTRSAKLVQD